MFSRRNLFKSLLGFLVAPKVAKLVVHQPEVKDLSPLVGYKGRELFRTRMVYAPYIPLMTTTEIMAAEIQKEIDNEMINRMIEESKKMPV